MPKKNNKRLPLPPSRSAVFTFPIKYVINNIHPSFENMSVWYWAASPAIFDNQIHAGFDSANLNSQTGFSKVIENKIIIEIKKPGAYMTKDKVIPPTIFYKIYNPYFGYTELQSVEI